MKEAFPYQYKEGNTTYVFDGMTLRDYFAAEALSAIISGLMLRRGEPGYTDEGCMVEAVRLSCIASDAMLKEREE